MLLTEIFLLSFKILNILNLQIFIQAVSADDKCVKTRPYSIFLCNFCKHFLEFEISNLVYQLLAVVEKNIKTWLLGYRSNHPNSSVTAYRKQMNRAWWEKHGTTTAEDYCYACALNMALRQTKRKPGFKR